MIDDGSSGVASVVRSVPDRRTPSSSELNHWGERVLPVATVRAVHGRVLRNEANRVGIKAGQMFVPVRVAVCGRKTAPPLFETLEVLGRDHLVK